MLCSFSSISAMYWWIENPDSSWMWFLPKFLHLQKLVSFHVCKVDYCRFGMHWRKRTRFLNNLPTLGSQTVLCNCSRPHTLLRGLAPCGILYTKLAEPYPSPLASALAQAALATLDTERSVVRLDTVSSKHPRPAPAGSSSQ